MIAYTIGYLATLDGHGFSRMHLAQVRSFANFMEQSTNAHGSYFFGRDALTGKETRQN